MTKNLEGLINRVKLDKVTVFGNRQRLKAECIGDKRGLVVQRSGVKAPIFMENVKHEPQLFCNLFNITAALGEGCKLDEDIESLKLLSKKGQLYVFNRRVKSGKSSLFAMKIIRNFKNPKFRKHSNK